MKMARIIFLSLSVCIIYGCGESRDNPKRDVVEISLERTLYESTYILLRFVNKSSHDQCLDRQSFNHESGSFRIIRTSDDVLMTKNQTAVEPDFIKGFNKNTSYIVIPSNSIVKLDVDAERFFDVKPETYEVATEVTFVICQFLSYREFPEYEVRRVEVSKSVQF